MSGILRHGFKTKLLFGFRVTRVVAFFWELPSIEFGVKHMLKARILRRIKCDLDLQFSKTLIHTKESNEV